MLLATPELLIATKSESKKDEKTASGGGAESSLEKGPMHPLV